MPIVFLWSTRAADSLTPLSCLKEGLRFTMATHMAIISQLYQSKSKLEINVSQISIIVVCQSFIGN